MITSFSTMRIKSALIFVEQWLQCWPLCSSAQIYVWILSGWKYPSGLVFKSHHPTSTQLSLNSRQKINKNSQQISTCIFEGIAASILGITFTLTCQCSTVQSWDGCSGFLGGNSAGTGDSFAISPSPGSILSTPGPGTLMTHFCRSSTDSAACTFKACLP